MRLTAVDCVVRYLLAFHLTDNGGIVLGGVLNMNVARVASQ